MEHAGRFSLVERSSLRQAILSTLRRYILLGRLRPGDRLMEDEIAQQMGVSRAPVREALRQLEQEGLIESIPHRGTYVVEIADEELEEIYQVRALLEGYAIRKAVTRLQPPDLERLTRLLAEMSAAAAQGDTETLIECDVQFHREIVRLAGSRALMRVWAAMDGLIRTRIASILLRSPRSDIIVYTAESHRPLLEALRTGDPTLAEQAVRQHIFETKDLLFGEAGRAARRPKNEG